MSSSVSDTEELIRKACRGDCHAGERLLAAHRDRIRRMVAARIDPRVAARIDPSDVVQEALAAAAESLPRYFQERPLPFIAWLRQFAWERLMKIHRHHIDAQKRSVTREESLSPLLSDESVRDLTRRLTADGTSPSQHVIRDEVRRQVGEALARLTPGDRELLIMRNVEQMAMGEIAEVLGINEGATKVRHLRALRRLRAFLEPSR